MAEMKYVVAGASIFSTRCSPFRGNLLRHRATRTSKGYISTRRYTTGLVSGTAVKANQKSPPHSSRYTRKRALVDPPTPQTQPTLYPLVKYKHIQLFQLKLRTVVNTSNIFSTEATFSCDSTTLRRNNKNAFLSLSLSYQRQRCHPPLPTATPQEHRERARTPPCPSLPPAPPPRLCRCSRPCLLPLPPPPLRPPSPLSRPGREQAGGTRPAQRTA